MGLEMKMRRGDGGGRRVWSVLHVCSGVNKDWSPFWSVFSSFRRGGFVFPPCRGSLMQLMEFTSDAGHFVWGEGLDIYTFQFSLCIGGAPRELET